MLEKIKRLFGLDDTAAVVRLAAVDSVAQRELLKPENKSYLKAFIEYGHHFTDVLNREFLAMGDRLLVKRYLDFGHGFDEKAILGLLERQDSVLSRALIASGSWAPFPYGNCLSCTELLDMPASVEEKA